MNRLKFIKIVIITLVILSFVLASLSFLDIFVPQANSWTFDVTQIDKLHELGFDGSGVTIGVIDTGVDIDHQEFDKTSFIAWNDFINDNQNYCDDSDHGTHIAGILISKSSFEGLLSGINMQGIAPGAELIVVKSISNEDCMYGGGDDDSIADGIQFCIDNGADVICLSLGKNPEDLELDKNSRTSSLCLQAINNGIFVIAPAGNDGQNDDGDVSFPSNLNNVIAVGAISNSRSIAPFSSKGHQYVDVQNPNKKPELTAPGVGITSTRFGGAYGKMGGTSQAAIYVAGVIALLLDAYPDYKHDEIKNQNEDTINLFKNILAVTAKKIGNLNGENEEYSHDDLYGYGLIQAYDAYEELAKY